jgi:hypothetical protein
MLSSSMFGSLKRGWGKTFCTWPPNFNVESWRPSANKLPQPPLELKSSKRECSWSPWEWSSKTPWNAKPIFFAQPLTLTPKVRGQAKKFFARPLMVPLSMKHKSSMKGWMQIVLLNLQLLVPKVGGQAKQFVFSLSWSSQNSCLGDLWKAKHKKKCV